MPRPRKIKKIILKYLNCLFSYTVQNKTTPQFIKNINFTNRLQSIDSKNCVI